jgi:hypothetical protein
MVYFPSIERRNQPRLYGVGWIVLLGGRQSLTLPISMFQRRPHRPGRLDWFEAKILNTNVANYPKESVVASARYVNSYPGMIAAHAKLKPILGSGVGILYHSVVPTATTLLTWGAHNNVQYLTSSGADINGITRYT